MFNAGAIQNQKSHSAAALGSFLFVAITLAVWHLNRSLVMSGDSYDYVTWASALLDVNFNYLNFLETNYFIAPLTFYLVPISIFALLMSIFGEQWQAAFHVLNIGFAVAALFVTYNTLRMVNVRGWIIALVFPLFLASEAYMVWPSYLLTDTFNVLLVSLLGHWILKSALENHVMWFPILLLTAFLVFTRPTALSLLGFLGWGIFAIQQNIFDIKRWRIYASLFSIIVFAGVAYSLLIWASLQGIISGPQVEYLVEAVLEGRVIGARPETYWENSGAIDEVLVLYLLRVIYFFMPYAEAFSITHNVVNTAFFAIVALSLAGAVSAISMGRRSLMIGFWVMTALTLITAIFHALTIIDFDWRYRFPVIAPLVIISGIGFELAWDRYAGRKHG